MAHHAAQWASRAARAVLEAKADDSHSSLCWDPRHGALMSQDLAVDGRAARIGVRLRDLTLICAGGGRTLSQFPLDGQTNSAAAAWVAEQLSGLGQDPSKLNDTLPYDLPTQPGAGGGAVAQSEGLAELALWFATADQVLAAIAGKFSGLRPGPSPVRCWPHHFDIATLIELDADGGENARSAGVGMTPGDDSRGQPYFYAAPWPYPEVADLRSLPPPAFWEYRRLGRCRYRRPGGRENPHGRRSDGNANHHRDKCRGGLSRNSEWLGGWETARRKRARGNNPS